MLVVIRFMKVIMVLIEVFVNCVITDVIITSRVSSAKFDLVMDSTVEVKSEIKSSY